MTIFTHTLENESYDGIITEIRYIVATARANERELLSIKLDSSDKISKSLSMLIKALRLMKKEGKIDFFASIEDFALGNAEASYLMNKFPDITDKLDTEKSTFIIKV